VSNDITFLMGLKTVMDGFLIGAAIMGGMIAINMVCTGLFRWWTR
jgi:hypothetical protein